MLPTKTSWPASKDKAVVVTRDSDFHMLLALSHADRPSVLWLRRTEAMKAEALLPLILRMVEQAANALTRGAIVTADDQPIRGRLLPIGELRD